MRKILIDAREINSSTGRYIVGLLSELQRLPFDAQFSVLVSSKDVDYWKPNDPRFSVISVPYRKFSVGEQVGFKKYLSTLAPDLVHFTMSQQPILFHGVKITTVHDLTALRFSNPAKNAFVFKLRQRIYGLVVRSAILHSKYVIVPTEYVKNDVIDFAKVDPNKIVVTLEAADKFKDTAIVFEPLADQKFIMYIGRPQPHKNLGRLIDAFQILLKDFPDLKLVLAGKKDVLFLQHEERVGELGLSKSVIFTDFVSDGQLRWLYENCAAYVFPSLSEGFGLPGLEAMTHGAPVVSSNATCLPEVHGDAAHYFDPEDAADMAKKIADVLVQPKLRAELISKGFTQAKKYSWRRMAEQTLDVYKKALGDK